MANQTIVNATPGLNSNDTASLEDATFSRDGNDLTLTNAAGDQTTYKDFFAPEASGTPNQLALSDGTILSTEDIIAMVELGNIAPAAGPAGGGGGTGGGAGFGDFDPGSIGDGLSIEDLLGRTDLEFEVFDQDDQEQGEIDQAQVSQSNCVDEFNEAVDGFLASWKAPLIPESVINDSDIAISEENFMVGDVYLSNSSGISFGTSINNTFTSSSSDTFNNNDLLDLAGASGNAVLVGDYLFETEGFSFGIDFSFSLNNNFSGVDSLTSHQYDDILIGGAFDDVMAGDFAALVDGQDNINAYFSLDSSFSGGYGKRFLWR